MTVGDRVKQLRELHGFTQSALVKDVPGLTQSRLSRLEGGLTEVDEETLELLAIALDVRSPFFYSQSSNDLIAQTPQLRARSRLTQMSKMSALRWAETLLNEYKNLEFTPLPVKLQEGADSPPSAAAALMRAALGFDSASPLPYLILAIERLGVVVLGIPSAQQSLDAFCAWEQGRPIIGVLDGVPSDRLRWNIAHELGHLVLHRGLKKHTAMENEADEFAAELLTPLSSLAYSIPKNPTLSHFTVLKTQWGVSIKSLVRRARELGVIDADRALSFYKQISARGWNKKEPGFVPEEKPRGLGKLAEIRYGRNVSVEAMSLGANWSEHMTRRVLSRHASYEELPVEADLIRPGSPNVIDFAVARRSQKNDRVGNRGSSGLLEN